MFFADARSKTLVQGSAAAVVCAALSALGCQSSGAAAEPLPVVAPELTFGTRHFVGSALSGPVPWRALPTDSAPADALLVRCRLTYHENLPRFDLPPLGTQARMIGALKGDAAILPNPVFTTRVQYANAGVAQVLEQLNEASADRSLLVQEFVGALLPTTCVLFAAHSVETVLLHMEGEGHRRMALVISQDDAGEFDFAIIIDQLAPVRDDQDAREVFSELDPYDAERMRNMLYREYLVLENSPSAASGPVALLIPSPFPGSPGGFSAEIEIMEAPTEGPAAGAHAQRVEDNLDDLAAERSAALESARRPRRIELEVRELAEALRGLRLDTLQRTSLVFLTAGTGAPLAEDLALIVDDAALRRFALTIVESAGDGLIPADGSASLGWILEQGAYRFVIDGLAEDDLPTRQLGLLLKHTGEAGHFPSILEDALSVSESNEDFIERIVAENHIFLEDHSFAARVRAYDWLNAIDRAPAGFDPLGDADSRRAALAAHAASADEGRP